MIAVLSPDYLKSVYGTAEWQTVWVQDAQGIDRKLLPVRVRDFELSGLLATVVYTDLFGTDETTARRLLEEMLDEGSVGRAKPDVPPPSPATSNRGSVRGFPGLYLPIRTKPSTQERQLTTSRTCLTSVVSAAEIQPTCRTSSFSNALSLNFPSRPS